jgi:hypothetical protein
LRTVVAAGLPILQASMGLVVYAPSAPIQLTGNSAVY